MDELIYQFLLQAGYPRASIVADATLLTPGGRGAIPDDAATFVIVDPDSAERLAVIEVVDAVDAGTLQAVSSSTAHYARRVGGHDVQGFVIRVDPRGNKEAEQVQFYRVWPNSTMQRLSAKTFPDLDALRVARKLVMAATSPVGSAIVDVVDEVDFDAIEPTGRGGFALVMPAILLILLAIADWYLAQFRGMPLLSMTQAVLAVGAATLFTLSALVRANL